MARCRRAAVSILLMASLCAGSVALAHVDGDDAACGPIFVNHNEAAHHIGLVPSLADGDAQHCYLCHSFRSVFSLIHKYEHRDWALHAEPLQPTDIALADRLAHSLALGRAPPA